VTIDRSAFPRLTYRHALQLPEAYRQPPLPRKPPKGGLSFLASINVLLAALQPRL